MSNKRRASTNAKTTHTTNRDTSPRQVVPPQVGAPHVAKARDPGDIISMIPYLLGFTPEESVVLIALEGPRRRFGPCMRMDLVDDPGEAALLAEYLLEVVERHGFDTVLVVVFTADVELSDAVVDELLTSFSERDVSVAEVLRADGRRWWSYTCRSACCPSAGTAYDVETSRMAAEAVLAGLSHARSRDALRSVVAPASGPGAERRRQQVAALCASVSEARPLTADAVSVKIDAALEAPEELAPVDIATLATHVSRIAVRDGVWGAMTRPTAAQDFRLWSAILRLAPDPFLPAVGCLAAFAAWLSGQGVLASHALDRVAEVDPGYRMMLLVRSVLDGGLNPAVWDETHPGPGWQ